MADPAWRLRGVRLECAGVARLQVDALDIPLGVTAVVGASGAGKTSLLNLLAGYEGPGAGRVERFRPAGDHALALFWVPPDHGLWPHLDARGHLDLVGAAPGDVDALLEDFALTERARARPAELSQGERARLAVARALAADPALLVMDEPFAHVDAALQERCWAALRARISAHVMAVVFSAHDPVRVLLEAHTVIGLAGGRVVFAGDGRELYDHPPTRELAELLGPANWLEGGEADRWLGPGRGRMVCLRPVQLALEPLAEGPCEVLASRRGGPLGELELRHAATGLVRRFWLSPPPAACAPGLRVALRLVGILAMGLMLMGCMGCTGEAPAATPRGWRSFQLPSAGQSLPRPRAVRPGVGDELLALDTAGRVLVLGVAGRVRRSWEMPETAIGNPEGLCLLRDGRVAVADTHYSRVVFFSAEGKMLDSLGGYGDGPGQFRYPVALAEDPAGRLYVSEYGGNDRVQRFDPQGRHLGSFGRFGTGDGALQRPGGILWREGEILVADAVNHRILRFGEQGDCRGVLGGERAASLDLPYDLAPGARGEIWVAEYGAGRVTQLAADGRLLGRYGRRGHGEGALATPWGLTVTGDGRIVVADTGNRRLVEFRP